MFRAGNIAFQFSILHCITCSIIVILPTSIIFITILIVICVKIVETFKNYKLKRKRDIYNAMDNRYVPSPFLQGELRAVYEIELGPLNLL